MIKEYEAFIVNLNDQCFLQFQNVELRQRSWIERLNYTELTLHKLFSKFSNPKKRLLIERNNNA
jgi:hypothetical protein